MVKFPAAALPLLLLVVGAAQAALLDGLLEACYIGAYVCLPDR